MTDPAPPLAEPVPVGRRRPIIPGSRVLHMDGQKEGMVLAMTGTWVWAQWDNGGPPETILMGYLESMPVEKMTP